MIIHYLSLLVILAPNRSILSSARGSNVKIVRVEPAGLPELRYIENGQSAVLDLDQALGPKLSYRTIDVNRGESQRVGEQHCVSGKAKRLSSSFSARTRILSSHRRCASRSPADRRPSHIPHLL
jgi:hypothetical protein